MSRETCLVADALCRELDVIVIDLWDRSVHECPLCGEIKVCRHAVAFYCEPTYDEIGSVSTVYRSTDGKPAIVGGMVCCKQCHDQHEAGRPNPVDIQPTADCHTAIHVTTGDGRAHSSQPDSKGVDDDTRGT